MFSEGWERVATVLEGQLNLCKAGRKIPTVPGPLFP